MRGRKPKLIPHNASGKQAEPPAHLSAEAKKVWHDVVAKRFRSGGLFPRHEKILELFCRTWCVWHAAQTEIERDGVTLAVKKVIGGQAVEVGRSKHPAVATAAEASRQLKAMLAELGMTPTRDPGTNDEPDDIDALYFGTPAESAAAAKRRRFFGDGQHETEA